MKMMSYLATSSEINGHAKMGKQTVCCPDFIGWFFTDYESTQRTPQEGVAVWLWEERDSALEALKAGSFDRIARDMAYSVKDEDGQPIVSADDCKAWIEENLDELVEAIEESLRD